MTGASILGNGVDTALKLGLVAEGLGLGLEAERCCLVLLEI